MTHSQQVQQKRQAFAVMRMGAWAFLSVASVITIAVPHLLFVWLKAQAATGQSGGEFLAVIIAPLLYAGFIVALLNAAYLGGLLLWRRPEGLQRLLLWGGLVVCLGYGLWGAVTYLQRSETPLEPRASSQVPSKQEQAEFEACIERTNDVMDCVRTDKEKE